MIKLFTLLILLIPFLLNGQSNTDSLNLNDITLKEQKALHPVKYTTKSYIIIFDFSKLENEINNYLSGYVVDENDSIVIADFKTAIRKVSQQQNDTIDFGDLPRLDKIYFKNDKELVNQSLLLLLYNGEASIKNIQTNEDLIKIKIVNKRKSSLVKTQKGKIVLKVKIDNRF